MLGLGSELPLSGRGRLVALGELDTGDNEENLFRSDDRQAWRVETGRESGHRVTKEREEGERTRSRPGRSVAHAASFCEPQREPVCVALRCFGLGWVELLRCCVAALLRCVTLSGVPVAWRWCCQQEERDRDRLRRLQNLQLCSSAAPQQPAANTQQSTTATATEFSSQQASSQHAAMSRLVSSVVSCAS